MKKVLLFIVLMSLPLLTVAQESNTMENEATTVESAVEKENTTDVQEKTDLRAETKAQVLDLNYKKSIEIISIKAYRKSLQIKVKTIKMC